MAEQKRHQGIVNKGYMDTEKGSISLSGVADTETDLAVIDNRGPRAGTHAVEVVAAVSANPNAATIKLKSYGSFDGTNWFTMNHAAYPAVSSGGASTTLTNGVETVRKQAVSLAGSVGTVLHPFPWAKWTILEETQDGAVGTVTAAVAGK